MKAIHIFLILLVSLNLFSQDSEIDDWSDDTFSEELSEGWSVKEQISVDFNGDGLDDIIEVSENPGGERRKIIFLIKESDGFAIEVVSSDTALLGSQDGGVWGDPWEGMVYKDGSLFISYYGGSRWRWSSRYQFKIYNGQWMLIGFEGSSFDMFNEDPDFSTTSCDFINGRKYVITVSNGERSEGWQSLEPAEPIPLATFDIQEYNW